MMCLARSLLKDRGEEMIDKVKAPFFVFNPKSYLYGDTLLEMAIQADQLAAEYPDCTFFVTCPYSDIQNIDKHTENIIVTAQHLDGISPGRGMGKVLPESIYHAGARATFLNHAEHPLSFSELVQSINKANELKIMTIVCADSIKEAKAIATLEPDIILCEPTELIGTGQTSDKEYVLTTNQIVKDISPNTLVMQAAGISSAQDVYDVIKLGADGTGCTSGIVKAPDPKAMLKDMFEAAIKAYREGDSDDSL